MNVSGAVLAGGRSRRMGRTKALIEIDGRFMADRVTDALRAAGADPVVIYGGDVDELDVLDADVVVDEHRGEGPVGGVLGALHHFANRGETAPDAVMVVACDMARLSPRVLQPLIDAATRADRTGGPGVWVASGDRIEPMCALWSLRAIPGVEQAFADGERALHRVIDRCDAVVIDVDPHDLVNINTPSDISAYGG